jgi:phosphoribosylformimino-5-aminoimidazole carboxamide ribonucleotide (ProFAR) isomerase
VRAISIPVELGGGIRTLESIESYLSLGVNRVILGTVFYRQKNFLSEACAQFPGRIVVGIDARDETWRSRDGRNKPNYPLLNWRKNPSRRARLP